MITVIDIDPANADADGIADALPVTGSDTDGIANDLPTGTAWDTGDAEWVTDEVDSGRPRFIRVTTAGNEPGGNAPTLTLIGTDANGNSITEEVVLPNATYVDTVDKFAVVREATADAATIDTFDIGWVVKDWNYGDDSAEWLATSAGDNLAHQLVVTTGGNETTLSNTMTITGTDADGNSITDTVTLPNTTTVETTKYFKTVTEAKTLDIGTAAFDIGWVDEVVTRSYPLDWRRNVPSHFYWSESGTLEADVEFTLGRLVNFDDQENIPWFLAVSGLDDVLDGEYFEAHAGLTAFRIKFNSYTDTAEGQMYVVQSET